LDGFDALIGDFARLYGPSVKLLRNSVKTEVDPLPRVTDAWSTPQGYIEFVDPTLPDDEIGLRLAAVRPATAPRSLKSASR